MKGRLEWRECKQKMKEGGSVQEEEDRKKIRRKLRVTACRQVMPDLA